MVTITISNITFTVKQDTSVTFAEAQNGSYTVRNANGETLNIGTAYPVESITKFTVDATPAESYKFLRWEVAGGAQLSPEQSGELMVPTGGTVQPVFVPENTPIFRVGTQAFGDLGEAIGCANKPDSAKTIVMTSDGSLKAGVTYTIPAGVTLLVPYADKQITETYMEKSPEESSGQKPWTINPGNDAGAPYANRGRTDPKSQSDPNVLSPVMDPDANLHRTLTIPASTTVRIEKDGVFSVGGVMSGGGHGTVAAAGGIIGQHSNIQLDGSIEVAGVFSCNGFVLGSGSITTVSGGAIYEPFVVMDFHAGSWCLKNMGSGSPMFLRYTMPNIQTEMTIVSGARLYGYCDLIGGSQHNVTTGVIIGEEESSLIVLASGGSVRMAYEQNKKPSRTSGSVDVFGSVGKSTLTISGGAHYGSLELKINEIGKLQSKEFPLTLPYNIDLVLKDGKFSINRHFYILPGANLTVGNGATLAIGTESFSSASQSEDRVSFAVFDGLEEHTNHSNFKYDATGGASETQAYAYPLPDELMSQGFNPIGGLTVAGGGTLKIGDYANFGGYVQASGENAIITTSPVAKLTTTANVGLWTYWQDDNRDTYYYLGRTSHDLTAKLVAAGAYADMEPDYTYTSTAVGESLLTSFTFDLYNTKTPQGDKAPTPTTYPAPGQTFNATVSGRFSGKETGNKVQLIQASGVSTFFKNVSEALGEADTGAVIKLVADSSGEGAVTIETGKEVTLDLNGHTLSATATDTATAAITNNGTLTIVDSGATKGKITSSSRILLLNNGTLSLEGVTLNCTGSTACLQNKDTINYISDCVLELKQGDVLKNSGTGKINKIEDSTMSVTGGSISSSGVYNSWDSINKISGTIDEISGCTIATKKGYGIRNCGTIGMAANCTVESEASKHAVSLENAKANMTIIGGTYTATGGNSVNVSSGTVTIYEGRFKGKSGSGITKGTADTVTYPIGKLSATPYNDGYYWVEKAGGYTITVSGSNVADVSLDGMGSGYKVTDKVTVAAPEVKGYTFTGWYRSEPEKRWSTDLVVKTTVAQMLADGLFDENGKADLVAKYEPVNDTYVTLKLNDAPDNTSVTGGDLIGDSRNTWHVPVGKQVTINVPTGTNFRYWTNANDKVMSKEKTYKFTMVTDTTLTAETSTSNTFVIFQSADGRLLSVQSDLNGLKLPDAPYRVGYTFKGWKVGSASNLVQKDTELADNLKGKTGTVNVVAAYEGVSAKNLTVTAYVGGAKDTGMSKSNLFLGEIATFTAPAESNGSYFRFWASDVNGTNILSFSTTYSFRVTQDTTIYAIYGGTSDKPNAQPVVRVDDVLAKNESGVKSLTFMIGASIPENYTLVEMGALYAKGSGTDEQLRVEKVGSTDGVYKAVSRLKHVTSLTDYSYALGFNMTGKTDTIYLRGYVAVKKTGDESNTIYYYYSGVTSKNYSAANS